MAASYSESCQKTNSRSVPQRAEAAAFKLVQWPRALDTKQLLQAAIERGLG